MEAVTTPAGTLWNGTVSPALVLDLDGTVRHSKADPSGFITGPDDVALFPGVEARLWQFRDAGYLLCGVSNQGGVAHGHKTVEGYNAEIDAMVALFTRNPFHELQSCFHMADGTVFPYNNRSLFRKPGVGMLADFEASAYLNANVVIDWDASLMVGDRPEDEECAANAGIPFQWADAFFGRDGFAPRPAPRNPDA